jgi:hypothetical protein
MQQQDQSEKIDTADKREQAATDSADTGTENQDDNLEKQPPAGTEAGDQGMATGQQRRGGFDWLAFSIALLVAAFFALTARFNSQPSPSFIPAAVFSATGCGLLVTALRKLRSRAGVGLREAALAGFGMTLFQFAIALTYPGVFTTITTAPEYGHAFLLTWGLVGLFAAVLSLAGAAIGHLVFAPLRPLPAKAARQVEEEDEEEEDEESSKSEESSERARAETSDEPEEENAREEEEEEETRVAPGGAHPRHSLMNYVIAVLLLGLLPMMTGYVFAAVYDFVMGALNVNQISPALYPTLSLLGGLLPWRLSAPINLNSAQGSFIVFTLLWRIPDSVLGNPNLFDVQALEAFAFNAAGLALLLICMYRSDHHEDERQPAPWGVFLLLEALLGLILILPANLWILRGLEGVLQIQNVVAPLPIIHLLNPTLFILNLLTGALSCVLIGLIARRQYQLWTQPRKET